MLDDEIILSGDKAKRLLVSENFPAENEFGAELYDGNEASSTLPVVRFDVGSIVTRDKVFPHSWFNKTNSEIIFTRPNPRLRQLIQSLYSAGELQAQNINQSLASVGFPMPSDGIDMDEKSFVLRLMRGELVPSEAERSKFFFISQKVEPLHWAVPHYERWLKQLERNDKFDALARMHLAYAFRHTRQLEKAVKVSVVVEFGRDRFNCSQKLMSVLATIRGASLLDIFELHNDPEILPLVRLTLNKAWFNDKSDEVSAVYRRLERYEREIENQNYQRKINSAYEEWANWV